MTGKCEPFAGNAATDYGTENEPNAIFAYEVKTGWLVFSTGFWTHPEHDWIGASPDGFVDASGCVECKCPVNGQTHSEVPAYYYAQVQGVLHCTGRDWCDFVSWTPAALNIIRVTRSLDYWNWMFPLLQEFWGYVQSDTQPPRLKRKPAYKENK